MTPAEKLARSRLAIVEHLQRRDHRREGREPRDEAGGDEDEHASHEGWLGGLAAAAKGWWRRHPAQLVLEMGTPLLQDCLRRKPFLVLGLAAGAGAALVLTRAWRLISLTTLLVAVVKSSQLSGAVMSAMASAQDWQAQRQGRRRPE